MKARLFLFVAGLLVSHQASASWFQDSCSDAAAKSQIFSGHDRNEVVLTEVKYSDDYSKVTETKLKFELSEIQDETLANQDLREELESSCEIDSSTEYGWYTSKKVEYKRVKFTKTDGSPFSKDTVGVSQDLQSVEADLICEHKSSGEMPCSNLTRATN